MLEVSNLTAGYGDIIAVRDLSFSIEAGSIFALMGANGAGKSSTIMSLMGLVERKSGHIAIDGEDISTLNIEARISTGLAIVPEGRRVFPDLSVHENLMIGGHIVSEQIMLEGIDSVYSYFPRLGERSNQAAGSLSGGEQQMLAIGRALISQPRILLIDELSLGLMPRIIDECYAVLETLKENNIAILLVEQNTERALSVADQVGVLEAGNMTWSGTAEAARENETLASSMMGAD